METKLDEVEWQVDSMLADKSTMKDLIKKTRSGVDVNKMRDAVYNTPELSVVVTDQISKNRGSRMGMSNAQIDKAQRMRNAPPARNDTGLRVLHINKTKIKSVLPPLPEKIEGWVRENISEGLHVIYDPQLKQKNPLASRRLGIKLCGDVYVYATSNDGDLVMITEADLPHQ